LPLRLLPSVSPNANEVCWELVDFVGGTLDRRNHSSSQDEILAPRRTKVEPSSCINTTETATPDLHLTHTESTSANCIGVRLAVPFVFIDVLEHSGYLAAPSGGELAYGQMGVLSPVLPERYQLLSPKAMPS